MTWDSLSVLAVVPARGGSKGIPDKNLRKVQGQSLVGHTARTAAALGWIDHTVLSTDDEKIAEEARSCGLDVPFLRPAELWVMGGCVVDAGSKLWWFFGGCVGASACVFFSHFPTHPTNITRLAFSCRL